ncbi:putative amidoligase enzyme-domain-containing protein [Pyronema omphalodes]|nr:putative amidoligase enzyme-domain-containing protein [Pyronema omphalodes]
MDNSGDLPPLRRKEKPFIQEEEQKKWILAQPKENCILGSAVEICTPILNQSNCKDTIRTVIEHLDKNFKVVHNESCGLHVHVGHGQGNTWPFEERKAIAKACLLFEEAVNLQHAPHRRGGNQMIRSNRWSTAARDATMLTLFEEIDDCDFEHQFLHLVGKDKYFKYNFQTNSQYGTIEFRQAEGHKDVKRIVAWIVTCTCPKWI